MFYTSIDEYITTISDEELSDIMADYYVDEIADAEMRP